MTHGDSGYRLGCRCETCKTGRREAARAWRAGHPGKQNEWRRQWRHTEYGRARQRAHQRRQNFLRRSGQGVDAEAQSYLEVLAGDPCCYCGRPAATVDHIVPIISGGGNDWGNLTAACARCNFRKNSKDLLAFLA